MQAQNFKAEVKKLDGPIVVFGAGGFIGANLVRKIAEYREDVFAVTSKPFIPWRLDDFHENKVLHCDITDKDEVEKLFADYNFKTVFDLAAYGAYSKQNETKKIYQTNVLGLLNILEISQKYHVEAIVHAGSSSEYGINCVAPTELAIMQPNSHYSVSKISAASLINFYGHIHEVPVCNLRYYSIYGPFEEPDRLVPQLIEQGAKGNYPPLVQPDISRDFVYVDDAIIATLLAANQIKSIKGLSINIASGVKTTLRKIVEECKTIFKLDTEPIWGDMPNRKWDLTDWYGDATLAKNILGWEAITDLKTGLMLTAEWQKHYAKPLYEKKIYRDAIKHKLSAIIACYKDEQAIPIMHQRLTDTFRKINVDYEIIFVNDCSPDNTNTVLEKIVDEDKYVVAIEHSRNFGSQAAFLSGMELSTGDAVILLDGDLQDPPELIAQFYEQWQQNWDVVYGRRVKREGNQVLMRFYKLFYRLFRRVSYVPIPLDAGDFSLMDRKVVDELIKLPETDQFMRGLRAWVGFKQIGVDYIRPERMFGVTTNNWRKNIAWARKAIFSFSFVPLELLTYLGLALTGLSFLAIIAQIIAYFVLPTNPHGVTTIICLILFFGGIQMLALATLGEYQAKILEETKRRPKFIRRSVKKQKQN